MSKLNLKIAKFLFSSFILTFGVFQNLHAQSCADGSYSYDNDILPILAAKCGSCHTLNSTAGFNVTTYNALLAGGLNCGPGVTPGDASPLLNSLIDKTQWVTGVSNANCGSNMPTAGTALTPEEFLEIQTWIENGAQESCDELADCLASHGNLGIKSFDQYFGCTDPQASNFNPNAVQENGSCIYDRDDFIGNYIASINCPNDAVLMAINSEDLTFEISQGLDPSNSSSVIITFTSGAIAGLSLFATVNGNNLTIPLTTITDLPINVGGISLVVDVCISGDFVLQGNQIIGQLNLSVKQQSGALLGADSCDLVATLL